MSLLIFTAKTLQIQVPLLQEREKSLLVSHINYDFSPLEQAFVLKSSAGDTMGWCADRKTKRAYGSGFLLGSTGLQISAKNWIKNYSLDISARSVGFRLKT